MRPALCLVGVIVLVACSGANDDMAGPAAGGSGGVGGGYDASGGSGGDPDASQFDVVQGDSSAHDATGCPDGSSPGDPGCTCGSLEFVIDTMQSCAMDLAPGTQVDGEGFITLGGSDHRVFVMDRWGQGHVVGWCDGTTLPQLLSAFDVRGYLGQTPDARVASFGDGYLCKPGAIAGNPLPSWITYQGEDLPAQYQSNAAGLAADWDVIILCGFRVPWSTDWSQELAEFVSQHGKGLLLVGEYEGGVGMPADYQNLSKIAAPTGIVFQPLNLAWAPSSASVSIDCVPDLPIPR